MLADKTKEELQHLLDEKGIDYTKRMTKEELIRLLQDKKYVVVHKFRDLQDNDHIYEVGDYYPRDGYSPSKKRIEELSSSKNKIQKVLIKEQT